MSFVDILKTRRSIYHLSSKINLSKKELESYLQEILIYTPSAFNAESQRMLVLTAKEHELLWDYLIETMKNIVKGEQYEKTKNKLNSFKAAYGTVLFFDDLDVIKSLQEKFPLYKDNFSKWSIEQNGMLQINVWLGLSDKNIGASLQHYDPLIEDFVKKTFDLPKSWELRAEMPFGQIEQKADPIPHSETSHRLIVK